MECVLRMCCKCLMDALRRFEIAFPPGMYLANRKSSYWFPLNCASTFAFGMALLNSHAVSRSRAPAWDVFCECLAYLLWLCYSEPKSHSRLEYVCQMFLFWWSVLVVVPVKLKRLCFLFHLHSRCCTWIRRSGCLLFASVLQWFEIAFPPGMFVNVLFFWFKLALVARRLRWLDYIWNHVAVAASSIRIRFVDLYAYCLPQFYIDSKLHSRLECVSQMIWFSCPCLLWVPLGKLCRIWSCLAEQSCGESKSWSHMKCGFATVLVIFCDCTAVRRNPIPAWNASCNCFGLAAKLVLSPLKKRGLCCFWT